MDTASSATTLETRGAGAVPGDPADARADITLGWLVLLRWGSVLVQLAAIGAARALLHGVGVARPLLLVGILVASNAALAWARPRTRRPRLLCGLAIVLDILLLTGLLFASGGPSNPFSVIYLVYIALAAVVLGPRWTWSLAVLSMAGYASLFAAPRPEGHAAHTASELGLHLQGMWVAFTVAAVLTAYFVVKLSSALESREAAMAEIRQRVARHERLASVTTLAAGAAHELGSPLATIAVASRELERGIEALPEGAAGRLRDDARLIRAEVERCRTILGRLAADSGQAPGESPVEVDVRALVGDLVEGLPLDQRSRLAVVTPLEEVRRRLPRNAFLQVARSLLQNAFDAGPGPVRLGLEPVTGGLRLRVEDRGAGIPPHVLEHVGEPFFSTKPPGAGLGLGLFIARSLSEQMGGRLSLTSTAGAGTTAVVEIGGGATPPRGGLRAH